uniref:RGS domain-containing protein n=1 Tax=Caenorhabditis tropicalis TaxID=1561998 RepID=A0A1I7TRW0_9PELO
MDFFGSIYGGGPVSDEERSVLVDTFKKLYRDYGRNFINHYRERYMTALRSIDAVNEDNPYFPEPNLDAEIISFKTLTFVMEGMFTASRYTEFFEKAERVLGKRAEIANKSGTAPEQKDWAEWSKYIVKRCNELDKKFPEFFRARLFEFFTPINRNLHYAMDDELVPMEPMNLEIPPSVDLGILIRKIEELKFSAYCGFMFAVLDEWLIRISGAMHRSFPETLPNYKRSRPIKSQERKDTVVESVKTDQPPFGNKPFPNICNGFTKCKWYLGFRFL